ncbi:MAG: ligase-associated DNA damage response endonuclease PdeM [Pseudomonadota bacterium]
MSSLATSSKEAQDSKAQGSTPRTMTLCGEAFEPCAGGALWWAAERTLIVADLHLEKGSSFATKGVFLPPYDTTATLTRLAQIITHRKPQRVIALGDSFHDQGGPARLVPSDLLALTALTAAVEWIWIAGNHDPVPPAGLGGTFSDELMIGGLTFRHEPAKGAVDGEIAGHLHPVARLRRNGRSVRRRCFATNGARLILPAFGALTGGLNVLDDAFAPIFSGRKFTAWMIGTDEVYPVLGRKLSTDMALPANPWAFRKPRD